LIETQDEDRTGPSHHHESAKDPLHYLNFDALMDAADLLPMAERKLLYGLVEFWFKVNTRNFVEYYSNRTPKT